MLYHTDGRLKGRARKFSYLKAIILVMVLSCALTTLSACTLLTKPFDNRTGFSQQLTQIENNIRQENWTQAKTDLQTAKRTWQKIKPLMQIDIDHDYVKDMEDGFTKLDGYTETKDKANSLVSVLLIKDTWEKIGSL